MSTVTINASSGSNAIIADATSWSNAIAGIFFNSPSTSNFLIQDYRVGSSDFEISHAFFFFDLTSIPKGSFISNAILRLPAAGNYVSDSGTNYIVSHTNTSPISASSANFNNIGSQVTWGNIPQASISTSTNNDITLTTTGRQNLIPGAVNKIALRNSHDINNTAPGSDGAGDTSTFTPTSVQLILTYTPPGASFLFNMV